MKRLHIFFALAASMMLGACSKDGESEQDQDVVVADDTNGSSASTGGTYCTHNFMDSFYVPTKVSLSFHHLYDSEGLFTLYLADFDDFWSNSIRYNSKDEEVIKEYKKYVDYYGDTTYRDIHFNNAFGSVCPLNHISVICDNDFDENHPANSSLDDLFELVYDDHYSFILGEYMDDGLLYHLHGKLVSEMDDVVPLLQPEMLFVLTKLPVNPGKYTFTVSMEFCKDPVSGKEVKLEPASVTVEF